MGSTTKKLTAKKARKVRIFQKASKEGRPDKLISTINVLADNPFYISMQFSLLLADMATHGLLKKICYVSVEKRPHDECYECYSPCKNCGCDDHETGSEFCAGKACEECGMWGHSAGTKACPGRELVDRIGGLNG
jgi:hypothetical protein